jgi:hypothetical protein
MFTRSNIFVLMFRIANLLAASFFVLCFIVPDSWCYGPFNPSPPPLNPHDPMTQREIIGAVVAFVWFVSALGLFFRSRLCWFGSLVGVGMMIIVITDTLVTVFRETCNDRQQLVGGLASEVFLALLIVGAFGICLAFSVGLFLGLLRMRRDLKWI